MKCIFIQNCLPELLHAWGGSSTVGHLEGDCTVDPFFKLFLNRCFYFFLLKSNSLSMFLRKQNFIYSELKSFLGKTSLLFESCHERLHSGVVSQKTYGFHEVRFHGS